MSIAHLPTPPTVPANLPHRLDRVALALDGLARDLDALRDEVRLLRDEAASR